MKDTKTKQRFVELRAQGKSQRTVADELTVGLQTAVRWERERKEQIEKMKAIELDALLERHRLTVQARVERFGGQLSRVMEELEKRDLSDIPTPKLVDLALKLDAQLRYETSTPTITDEAGLKARKAQLKFKATLGDNLNEAPLVNFVQLPEYVQLVQVMMRVLEPYPEIREEIAQALLEAEIANKRGNGGNGKK